MPSGSGHRSGLINSIRMVALPLTSRKSLLLLLFVALFAGGCEWFRPLPDRTEGPRSAPVTQTENRVVESPHLAFGNPTDANTNDPDNYLIVGDGSIISYNNSRGTANWISWRTTREDLGPAITRPEFRPDPRLPEGFRPISPFDYSRSGYDRGHLVPSADRFADPRLNEKSFFMTNIVPQTPALNRYPWERFESYARGQARRGYTVYQIAGIYGRQRVLMNGLVVPTNCWKVISIVPAGKRIEDMDRRMRIIAVDMPNIPGIENEQWEKFRVSIREIEQRTGFDLFRGSDPAIQERLETWFEMKSR